jgi:hypothetical protein
MSRLTKNHLILENNLESVQYDFNSKKLKVIFLDGTCYLFLNVPQQEFENLIKANVKGSHFNRYIRKQYEFERIC